MAIVGRRPSNLAEKDIKRAVDLALAGAKKTGEINVAFVDSTKMRKLNKEYRHKDKPTDVLSFAYHENAKGPVIGDVIICPAYAKNDSAEQGVPYAEQLRRLIVHGTLHVCGYDHIKDADAEIMLPLQEKVVTKL